MKFRDFKTMVDDSNPLFYIPSDGANTLCQVLPNNTVLCHDEVYESFDSWKEQKNQLDQMIQEYKERLDRLKVSFTSCL